MIEKTKLQELRDYFCSEYVDELLEYISCLKSEVSRSEKLVERFVYENNKLKETLRSRTKELDKLYNNYVIEEG